MPLLASRPSTPVSLPFWIRAVLALDRVPRPLARAVAAIREEVLLAWVAPERRHALTVALFDRQATYAPGGNTFNGGLFDWERELLAHPIVPRSGRILLGGAGGGREIVALRDLGYEVVAFEPAASLARAGADAFSDVHGGSLVHASYEDFVRAVRGERNALSNVVTSPFDALMLGWGSISHVMEDGDRSDILRAMRSAAPNAPLLLSFDEPTVLEKPGGVLDRTRRVLRRLFALARAPGRVREGDRFVSWAGFFRESSAADIKALARDAGYQVAFIGVKPGRAILVNVAP
ncbi:MAG: hypothetical protein H7Z74_13595 [Anaerolineae bacterium]|nr:hypothetical protein [Gemmatimonadaceae bacterium]